MDKAPDAFRTISEVAEDLDLPQHVLRFWETRFSQIKPMKRGGGRRYYRPDDVDLLRGIRHLLYSEGYTIRGVQRILKDHGIKFVQSVWQAGAPQPTKAAGDLVEAEGVAEQPEGERGRGLFGLLPPFLASDAEAAPASAMPRRQPPIEEVTRPSAMPAASDNGQGRRGTEAGTWASPQGHGAAAVHERGATPSRGGSLAAEDIAKLEATLSELAECRRLLDGILTEKT
ncbi:MAG: MerR family transcriptional regulator [Xanthobacteraceae bacterium]